MRRPFDGLRSLPPLNEIRSPFKGVCQIRATSHLVLRLNSSNILIEKFNSGSV